jgi:hypothetical protein
MSNRLEQEFPRTSWRAIPPVGPRGLDEALWQSIARGHELRSQAVRKSARRHRGRGSRLRRGRRVRPPPGP